MKHRRVVTISRGLRKTGFSVAATLAYPEHHEMRKKDIQLTLEKREALGLSTCLTVENLEYNYSPPPTNMDSQLWEENTVDS